MDALFAGKNPSVEEIVLAKKSYWKSYNLNLIRRRRALKTEFTIGLSKQELNAAKHKMTKEKSITEYIRKVFIHHLNSNISNLPIDTAVIEQQLFMVVGYLEDMLDNESLRDEKISTQLESHIKRLESLIQTHFDN